MGNSMHKIKAFITEARIYDVFDLFKRKPRGLGFNNTDVIVIEAKSKEGNIRVKENFFTCLKGNGTFSLDAPNRVSSAARQKLAKFLTYYHLTDDPEKYNLVKNVNKWVNTEIEIAEDNKMHYIFVQ